MRRVLALLLILFPLFMTACVTSGGNVVEPRDRTTALMEALAENPTGQNSESVPEIVLPTPETVREVNTEAVPAETPPEEEPVAEEVLPEPVSVPAAEEAAESTPLPSEPVPDPVPEEAAEEDVVISFPPEEDEIVPLPAEESSDVIPVSGEAEEAEPVIYPVAVPADDNARSIMDEPMKPWMLCLMAVLIVDMILFTTAAAIRNAYKAPLNRLVSAAIAVLFTSLSWVLSYIIAGQSGIYAAYLLLLFTYFVFRSKGRSHQS